MLAIAKANRIIILHMVPQRGAATQISSGHSRFEGIIITAKGQLLLLTIIAV